MASRKNRSKATESRKFTPDIDTAVVDTTERNRHSQESGNLKKKEKVKVVEYLGNRTPCPECGAVKLLDGLTQACVVVRTMPEVEEEKERIINRYMLCRMCGITFLGEEKICKIP